LVSPIEKRERKREEKERERERREGGRGRNRFIVLGQAPLEHITEIKAKCKRYTRHCTINKYKREIEDKEKIREDIKKRIMQLVSFCYIQDYVI